VVLGAGGLAALISGCAEPQPAQPAYVPVYSTYPAYAGQPPTYTYQGQTVYQAPPGTAPAPSASPQVAPAPQAPPGMVPQAPPAGVTVESAPPPPQVEVVPVAPGPSYVWAPGYWGWNGAWVWVGGHYVIRPHPHAVYVGPHWVRHGHGYIWIGGSWH
jgi:hypothetical protein